MSPGTPRVTFSLNGGPVRLEHVFQEGRPDIIRLVDAQVDPQEPEHVVWQAESQRLRAPAEAQRETRSQNIVLSISPAVFFLDSAVVILLSNGAALHLPTQESWGHSVTATIVRPMVETGSSFNGSQFILLSNASNQKVVFVLEIAGDGTLRGSADLFDGPVLPTAIAFQGLRSNKLPVEYLQHMQRPLTLSVLDPSMTSLGFQRSRRVQTRAAVRTEALTPPPAPPWALAPSPMTQRRGLRPAIVQVAEIIAEYDSDRRLVVAILEDGSVSIVEDGAAYTEHAVIERAPGTESGERREAVRARVEGDRVLISRGGREWVSSSLSAAMNAARARVPSLRDLACAQFFSRGAQL